MDERPDSRTDHIIGELIRRKHEHEKRLGAGTGCEYAVFMDFDGTVIYGDITEGKAATAERQGYRGLAEMAIHAGLIRDFRGEEGFKAFEKRYRELEARDHQTAYVWLADQFSNIRGRKKVALDGLVVRHCRRVLHGKLFASSVKIIDALQAAGIVVYIVSASPHVFVRGLHSILPQIPRSRMTGIGRERDSRGRLIDPIVNYGPGKVLRVRRLSKGRERPIVVLGGLGNSWHTDGAFLEWIVEVEKGFSVMINGGPAPKRDHGLFEVTQERILEDR